VKGSLNIALSMFDTKEIPGYVANPFDSECAVNTNPLLQVPSDAYFIIRVVQLLRGCTHRLGLEKDFSLCEVWRPYAERALSRPSTS
jgi:hypothetical protein